MQDLVNIEFVKIIIFCGVASFLLVPLTVKIAYHINAISMPHSRHIHTKAMPLLGGVAIFLSFIFGFIIFSKPSVYSFSTLSYEIPAILIASTMILLLGIIDDIKPLNALVKFIVQILIALIIIFYGKLRIDDVLYFIPTTIDSIISIILTIFWIVSVINAINIVDGLNGLSAGVSSIYFVTVIILYIFGGNVTQFALLLSSLMFGATLGYLPWNFPKAKVFMGDAGSMFLGLIISLIPLLGFKQVTLVSLFLPMIMMIIPVFEIFSTVIRRKVNNKSLGEADNNHLHHQLLRSTKSPLKAVLIIWCVSILFSIDAIILEIGNFTLGIIFFVLLAICAVVFIQLSKEFNNHKSIIRKILSKFKK
ncbi:MAG: MraY family glycosyltransferase [Bacilli bacterium]